MNDWQAIGFIALGVIVSVLFPVLAARVRRYFPATKGAILPKWLERYAILFAFGLVSAGLLYAIWRSQNPEPITNWYTAFLLGYSWQSTIDALFRPKP